MIAAIFICIIFLCCPIAAWAISKTKIQSGLVFSFFFVAVVIGMYMLGVLFTLPTYAGGGVALLMFIIGAFGGEKPAVLRDQFNVPLIDNHNKVHFADSMDAGTLILGASGSGKTKSVFRAYIEHCAKQDFAGVIYDFKNFELTAMAGTLFTRYNRNFKIFALHDVNLSVRVNPISPRYMNSENAARSVVKHLLLNIKGEQKGDNQFFTDAAEGLIVAIIWRLKKDYPTLCNLPFIASILLQISALNDGQDGYGNLIDFIKADPEAEIKASAFLSGVTADKQTAAVFATVTNLLTIFDNPNIAYLLSGEDISLDVTEENSRCMLSIVNYPKDAMIQTPISAALIEVITGLIDRGRQPSAVILDEGASIEISNLAQKITYLRSYGCCFIYGIQGLILGKKIGKGDVEIKQIICNLSTQFFGKINDPETGNFYEQYFDFIKEQQLSYSSGGGILARGESRVNKSFKERKKIRSHEFQQLKKGEFVVVTGGKDKRFQFKYIEVENYDPPIVRALTDIQVRRYYSDLLALGREFISGGWKYDIEDEFQNIQI